MNPGVYLTVGLAAASAVAALGAWASAKTQRRRRKTPAELERIRRLDLNRRGRIAAAQIVEVVESAAGEPPARLVLYNYEVAGVSYAAAQDISALSNISSLGPGCGAQTASVKYDPQEPTNSIIACEEWCGVRNIGSLGH